MDTPLLAVPCPHSLLTRPCLKHCQLGARRWPHSMAKLWVVEQDGACQAQQAHQDGPHSRLVEPRRPSLRAGVGHEHLYKLDADVRLACRAQRRQADTRTGKWCCAQDELMSETPNSWPSSSDTRSWPTVQQRAAGRQLAGSANGWTQQSDWASHSASQYPTSRAVTCAGGSLHAGQLLAEAGQQGSGLVIVQAAAGPQGCQGCRAGLQHVHLLQLCCTGPQLKMTSQPLMSAFSR